MKYIIIFMLSIISTGVKAQWSYIQSMDTCIDANSSSYFSWLKKNGYAADSAAGSAAQLKAASLSTIFNMQLTGKGFRAVRQPVNVRCYSRENNSLVEIDMNMINPAAGELENVQLVILKSGFRLVNEVRNEKDKTTKTIFENKIHRITLNTDDEKTFLIISATSLSLYGM